MGAWLVLRANQVWAPFPDNDPDAARRMMTRFYRLLRKSEGGSFDPVEAARLEVEWWRAHREAQHAEGVAIRFRPGAGGRAARPLRLLVRGRPARTCCSRPSCARRPWTSRIAGWRRAADPENPMLAEERALLVRSYAALLAAVHR